jgi:uncharacterized protein YecE (DUF72 family)
MHANGAAGGAVAVGTSGWSYRHWRGRFYPEGLGPSRWLAYYAERFSTVEINASFYRLPSEQALRRWADTVPPGFRFALKGSRLITHTRRLANAERAVETFLARASLLGDRLACVLWQLPPTMPPDLERLDRFLASLPPRPAAAVELRNPAWLDAGVLEVLERHGAAYTCVSSRHFPALRAVTAPLVYVRFHGLTGGYAHDYSARQLRPWADFLSDAAADGRSALVYFNNDGEARAPANAERLRRQVARRLAASPSGRMR